MSSGRDTSPSKTNVAIIGAGPGGLTAAYELVNSGIPCRVYEAASKPGGLARTEVYKGYRFDIGGHRFFSKVAYIEKLWRDWLGDDLLERPRLSRIYYRGRFFKYPLEPLDALKGLGAGSAMACLGSYVYARLRPTEPEHTFDAWISNRFGRRLFDTFFKTYTEKVWGMPCDRIGAEWAAQRIRGLDPLAIARHMFGQNGNGSEVVKTLIGSFRYPRLGPGMMWERCADIVRRRGGRVEFGCGIRRILWKPGEVTGMETCNGIEPVSDLISTMPLRELVKAMDPAPPQDVIAAAERLTYRDFLTVALIVDEADVFPDNWIYVHDPDVRAGRIQNYKNWSRDMVPDPARTCLGLEYFCREHDDLWSSSDADLLRVATADLMKLGLAAKEKVIDGAVVRVPKAYPVYDREYQSSLRVIRRFLDGLPNLQVIGRNGMHRYNNQDHSMLTGILAARNVAGASHDLWDVNADTDYLEEGIGRDEIAALHSSQPFVPTRVAQSPAQAR